LRIADASIMPVLIGAPTHPACLAIGEQGAGLLRGSPGRATAAPESSPDAGSTRA
jgi:choline dehydrogenase-like flavoprotein